MGENDGSSGAAPSAQSDIDTDLGVQTGGFFARVIGALSPSEATVEEEAPTNPRPFFRVEMVPRPPGSPRSAKFSYRPLTQYQLTHTPTLVPARYVPYIPIAT